MNIIGEYFKKIVIDAEKRKDARQKIKAVERAAYEEEKRVQDELKFQEDLQKAAERGRARAHTNVVDQVKQKVEERRAKVAEQRQATPVNKNIEAILGANREKPKLTLTKNEFKR